MSQFSRSIYRELAPDILEDRRGHAGANHQRVLQACESAIYRLATDRHYFARPSRTLFNDIRPFFPMNVQCRVFRVVDLHMHLAARWLDSQAVQGFDLAGNRLECRATTRRGTPCQRTPLVHNGYCPSISTSRTPKRSSSRRSGWWLFTRVPGRARPHRLHRPRHHGIPAGGEPSPHRL